MATRHYLLQFFSWSHLSQNLQEPAILFQRLAYELDDKLPENPEKTTALRKLLEAKDCAVRAVLFQQDREKVDQRTHPPTNLGSLSTAADVEPNKMKG